jgi:hypothetical protein
LAFEIAEWEGWGNWGGWCSVISALPADRKGNSSWIILRQMSLFAAELVRGRKMAIGWTSVMLKYHSLKLLRFMYVNMICIDHNVELLSHQSKIKETVSPD